MYVTKVTAWEIKMSSDDSIDGNARPGRLDVAVEVTWLSLIFLLPVYFNPLGYQAFYFAKSLLLQFGTCLLLGLYLARWFLAGRHGARFNLLVALRQSPLQVAVTVFGLLWAVSTVLSIMPEASFWGSLAGKNGLISIIAWVVFFLIVAQGLRLRPQLYRALGTLVLSSTIVSLIGILLFIYPQVWAWSSFGGRVASTDGNPLSLSGFIAMVLPVNLALVMITWHGHESRIKKMLKVAGLLLAFALQVICLCLAQYSITILLFIPGMFIFILLTGICFKKRITIALSTVALVMLLLLAAIIIGQTLMPRTVDTYVGPATPDTSVAGQAGLNTLGLRAKQWTCAISVVLDSPEVPLYKNDLHFLRRWIGYGPEMLVISSQADYPVSMKSNDTYNSMLLGQPENHYLYLAATVGLLGLAAFLAIILIFFYLGLRLLRTSRQKDVIYLTSAFMAGIAQYCVHILFNQAAILPELVFWLILALTAAMARMEMTGGHEPDASGGYRSGIKKSAEKADKGKFRKGIAGLVVIVFIGMGFSLTFSPAKADMKLNSALRTWSSGSSNTMRDLAEAVSLEPGQAVYYGYIGAYAFKLAIASNDAAEKSKLMALSTVAYEAAGKREPYLAYWSYTTGDAYSYWAGHADPGKWKDALRCYERADILLPDDAVILNKWALALMLSGDYSGAGRKISQSRDADAEWIQTTYYAGLLDVYERYYCTAGYCFVCPVEQNVGNIGPYISFCSQLALYGGLDKAVSGLKVYTACHSGDWIGQALLGIAEVYGDDLAGAGESFRKAANNVAPGDAGSLMETVTRMGVENRGFQPMAQEIAASLAVKIPGNIK
jgi:tetratricopeptide (TPR) repeat protein